jgi:TRAP-type C4-dicarboxylate transport system substrate-binding protein/DNA-binding XRE family transcriptional regulator
MYSPMPAENVQADELEERIQLRVGARVRELRQAAGITAVVLAERTGISQGQLSKIENGKAALSVKVLARLCRVFDRPVGYLFQGCDEMPRILGTLTTVQGPENTGIRWFAEEVRRLTGGGLALIPLRPSQIGSAAVQVVQLKDGLIDLFVEEPHYFSLFVPGFDAFCLPYAFGSESHRRAFLGSPFFRERLVKPLRRAGIRIVNRRWNWLRGLEWVLAANRPVVTPGDLHGLTVRIVEGRLMRRFWQALGARPVAVPWAEVGAALRAGDIDLLPTHKAHLYPLEFCRHTRFVSLLGDLPPVLSVAVNEAKYRILRPDTQNALLDACDRAGDFFSTYIRQAEAENEALNIARFNTAYLKVSLGPWHAAVARTRDDLLAEGLLDSETAAVVAATGPPREGKPVP